MMIRRSQSMALDHTGLGKEQRIGASGEECDWPCSGRKCWPGIGASSENEVVPGARGLGRKVDV